MQLNSAWILSPQNLTYDKIIDVLNHEVLGILLSKYRVIEQTLEPMFFQDKSPLLWQNKSEFFF